VSCGRVGGIPWKYPAPRVSGFSCCPPRPPHPLCCRVILAVSVFVSISVPHHPCGHLDVAPHGPSRSQQQMGMLWWRWWWQWFVICCHDPLPSWFVIVFNIHHLRCSSFSSLHCSPPLSLTSPSPIHSLSLPYNSSTLQAGARSGGLSWSCPRSSS